MSVDEKYMNECRGGVAATKFEDGPIGIQFKCEHAVYPVGGASSMCYTTDELRAKLIAEALSDYGDSTVEDFLQLGGTLKWNMELKEFEAELRWKGFVFIRNHSKLKSTIKACIDDYRAKLNVEKKLG